MAAQVHARLALLLSILLAGVAAGAAQNCGCSPDLCCSKFGNCGTGDPYCGDGCQSGPCSSSVASVVTQAFFDGIVGQAAASCPGKSFGTRAEFLKAADAFPNFGKLGTADDSKREIAAFFAYVARETGSFCHIGRASQDNCDTSSTDRPCVTGKMFFGRGYIQTTWSYNYGRAGRDNSFVGLGSPETVANDATLDFKTALWFWMNNVHPVVNQGFGATIRKISGGLECDGMNTNQMNELVQLYKNYSSQLGVDPGNNLTC